MKTIALTAALFVAASAQAQSVDLTLFDAPYNLSFGGRAPSMRQSLDLTVAGYEIAHGAIRRSFSGRVSSAAMTAIYDLVFTAILPLPFTDGWLHEEFHRAQMGRRGVGSFNDIYLFDFGATAIAVSHVRDADILALKANHPAEWVRVNSAGGEGELLLVRELETRSFRGQSRGWHLPLYWLTKVSTWAYVASSTWSESETDTDQMNLDDGVNVAKRDFTGHDYLAWVYDLHRPTEPYDARGVHPSGVGIDRYIKPSDLSDAERRYIKRQGKLQLLNFVDPFLYEMTGFRVGGDDARPRFATLSLGHSLTASGYTIDAHFLTRRHRDALSVIARAYVNDERTLPGIEVTAFDRPARIAGRTLELTPRVALWMQPKGQAFRTRDAEPGGLASLRIRGREHSWFGAFVEVEGKTAGWVAGTPYLNSGMAFRTGAALMR